LQVTIQSEGKTLFWRKKEPEDYVERKEYQKAIGLYKQKLASQPTNTALLMNMADTLLLDKQVDLAIDYYRKAAEIQTEQGFVLKAIAIYKKILKFQPDHSEVTHLLNKLSERMSLASQGTADQAERKSTKSPKVEVDTPLFKGLSEEESRQLVSKLQLRHFPKDAVVVREGDPGDSMFVVVHGDVRVLTHTPKGKEVFLANLGEGEFFGEIALLTGKPRTATILTNSASDLLELTREDYDHIVSKFPNVKAVVEAFHLQRTYKTVEAMIQAQQPKTP
jgi:cAMP-dependent protein kinase regulator